uniref:Uncharacterized protein n=1 Tax=Arundo donax TaxID=35708 RepID=A0A0A8Y7I5_ARUDO
MCLANTIYYLHFHCHNLWKVLNCN